MTVTIKNSNNNVVGTAESISINVEYAKETYQPADIVRDEEGNYISSKPIVEPQYFDREVFITFKLINPNVDFEKLTEEYNIEATKVNFSKFNIEFNSLVTLYGCTLNEKECTAKKLHQIDLSDLKAVFKYYFPSFPNEDIDVKDKTLLAFIKEAIFYIHIEHTCNTYISWLWSDNHKVTSLHESTDLNELMQVTKQKLTDMFADWSSKVN